MSECFIGEIILWPVLRGPPVGWLRCDGSLQSIANYEVLYQLLGTVYGGDGQNTFGLPDLRSRVPLHRGSGPGLTPYSQGQIGGTEQVTLTTPQMAAHNHALFVASAPGTASTPTSGGAIASMGPTSTTQTATYAVAGGTQVGLAGASVGPSGNNQPHTNVQPSLGISYIICYQGVFPSPG